METIRVVLRQNNCISNDPCAICGGRTDPVGGLDYFLGGTYALVCDPCAERYAPRLRPLLGRAEDEADPVSRLVVYGHEYDEADVDRLEAESAAHVA